MKPSNGTSSYQPPENSHTVARDSPKYGGLLICLIWLSHYNFNDLTPVITCNRIWQTSNISPCCMAVYQNPCNFGGAANFGISNPRITLPTAGLSVYHAILWPFFVLQEAHVICRIELLMRAAPTAGFWFLILLDARTKKTVYKGVLISGYSPWCYSNSVIKNGDSKCSWPPTFSTDQGGSAWDWGHLDLTAAIRTAESFLMKLFKRGGALTFRFCPKIRELRRIMPIWSFTACSNSHPV